MIEFKGLSTNPYGGYAVKRDGEDIGLVQKGSRDGKWYYFHHKLIETLAQRDTLDEIKEYVLEREGETGRSFGI